MSSCVEQGDAHHTIAEEVHIYENTHERNNISILIELDHELCAVIGANFFGLNRSSKDDRTFTVLTDKKGSRKVLPSIMPLPSIGIWLLKKRVRPKNLTLLSKNRSETQFRNAFRSIVTERGPHSKQERFEGTKSSEKWERIDENSSWVCCGAELWPAVGIEERDGRWEKMDFGWMGYCGVKQKPMLHSSVEKYKLEEVQSR